jgi:hypothetical protein
MAKPIPKLKQSRRVRASKTISKIPTTLISGFDVSMMSMAGAAIAWDATLNRWLGPAFVIRRWNKDDHYFDRISEAVKSHDLIWDLISELKLGSAEMENVFIAQEEPWPMGMAGKMQSQTLKQQAEISGAFLGGLLRYGYTNIYQIHNTWWRGIIADDLGITIHHSKWKDPKLAERFNCKPNDTGKFRAKQWALMLNAITDGGWQEVPDWPDLIRTKEGLVPRPETSKAKSGQPDDRYDALAMMKWMRIEWEQGRE